MIYNEKIAYNCELLINYGLKVKLFDPMDTVFVRNSMLSLLMLDKPYGECDVTPEKPFEALEAIMDAVAEDEERKSILLPDDTITYRDLLDTAIMGCMTPWPSAVTAEFNRLKACQGIKAATDYFYHMAVDSNYIHRTE